MGCCHVWTSAPQAISGVSAACLLSYKQEKSKSLNFWIKNDKTSADMLVTGCLQKKTKDLSLHQALELALWGFFFLIMDKQCAFFS